MYEAYFNLFKIFNYAHWDIDYFYNSIYLNEIIYNNYKFVIIYFIFGFIFSLILIIISYLLFFKKDYLEKNKTYECGFDTLQVAKKRNFSFFFRVAILFLLFDLEIIFFVPWCSILKFFSILKVLYCIWIMVWFLFLLVLAFFFEWVHNVFEKI